MKIVLLSPENTLVCFGIRMISAILKTHGHTVKILFVPREFNQLETPEEVEILTDWVAAQEPELIGVSLMSSHIKRMLPIQDSLKRKIKVPIVWGGIHPTLKPEECLEYTDYVCVGEGEKPFLELADTMQNGDDISSIANMWIRTETGIVRNTPRDRYDDLDELPYADHDHNDHRVWHGDRIREVDEEVWRSYIPGFMDTHYVMSSRGCPHNCTYCCNSALRKVTGGPYLRRRSPAHFVGEMKQIKSQFPRLKGFVFMDDSFFYGTREWFERFCELYRRDIDLPFFCWANPVAVTEERIAMLSEAGLVGVHVGLESASPKIADEIYKRGVSQEQFYKCMDILHRHRDKVVDIRVDVITDNPYETEDDTAETIRVLSYLKKPVFVGIVSLMFYPQTELEEMAIRDGYIAHGDPDLYQREFFHYQPTMMNRLMRSVPMTPGKLIRFFLNHRKSRWGRALFYLYYFGYFIAVRRQLRALKRRLTLAWFKRFEAEMDPRKVVTTRVALIDF